MNTQSFVHLRLHSEYSIADGTVRIDEEVSITDKEGNSKKIHICPPAAKAAKLGMPAVALTDLNNLFGAVRFYKAAIGAGVQPIIGADCFITNDDNRDRITRILLLVTSQQGYLNLCELLSRGFLENQYRGHAELKRVWLTPETTSGLICLSGFDSSPIALALEAGKFDAACDVARDLAQRFPDAFYIEVQRVRESTEPLLNGMLAIAAQCAIPAVATHSVQFMEPSDFEAHEVKVCITQGYTMSDQRRAKEFNESQYFKSPDEMATLFHDLPQLLENAVEIAKRCAFCFVLGKPQLPRYPTPNGESEDDYLRATSEAGLEQRLKVLYPDQAERVEAAPRYKERLDFEVNTIIKMGFPGYFLIVADFINWSKNNGVPVGPGRGSGAGSLVAYSLSITDLDPLKYELLFERFLNPERVSMPDFDIDFCPNGRDRVIGYVRDKFGAQCVSQIATFGTMAARAAVRDVGRVLEWGYNRTDELAKLIPQQPGKQFTLAETREMEPKFKEREEQDEEAATLIKLAEEVEGLTRNIGMHAGGVLIAPGKLTDFTPLYRAEGADSVVSQYDKDDVEAVGLVKFDFLGLTTLTIIDHAVRHVKRLKLNAGDEQFNIDSISLDDLPTYAVFQKGATSAIFQFESRGMRDLLKKARPDRLEDLIALNALYRPGPMDLIPDFTERKHGRQTWEYLDPRIAPILDPTYGIMVYQEQVMQVAQVVGGYSLGGADLLRRAMGKKKPEEMAAQRLIFKEGSGKGGLEESKAMALFDLMEKFAGYGFNKSHAAAYAWVAYQTAYLKAHHPAAFMAANLSLVMDDTDKVKFLFDDALDLKLTVLPPSINAGSYEFMPINATTLTYGLGAVKGTGQQAVENIIAARNAGGPFKDLGDFCMRVDRRMVNRRTIETLIKGGAFDELNNNRASLIASVGAAIELADKAEAESAQDSLFGDAASMATEALKLIDSEPWSERERLLQEKGALGFYLSGHLFTTYHSELKCVFPGSLASVQPSGSFRDVVTVTGILESPQIKNTKRGKMATFFLDDGTAKVEVTVMGELLDERRDALKSDQPMIVEGRASADDFNGGVRINANRLLTIDDFRAQRARELRLTMNGQADPMRLRKMLAESHQGPCKIVVNYSKGDASADFVLGDRYRIAITEQLVQSLKEWLKEDNVVVGY